MKYEYLCGYESDFLAMPENIIAVVQLDHCVQGLTEFNQITECGKPVLAMRRIIAEPKRWTVEDQRAGRLPDVGYEYIGRDVLLTCVFVDKNRVVWGKSKDNLMYCHDYSEIKPIETPEEKAQRLRSEWINKAYVDFHRLGCELEVLQKEQIKQIYDALLSGELTMPNKDGE